MKSFIVFTLFLLGSVAYGADEVKYYDTLDLFISDLTIILEEENGYEKLDRMIDETNNSNYKKPRHGVYDKLKAYDLKKLYKDIDFPGNKKEFKLGGHMAELGNIHIDFVKETEGWRLNKIWQCK